MFSRKLGESDLESRCPLQKPEYKKGGSIEPPFDHNHFYYSAKTTTLFFITSTVPPLTSNFISFPD